MDEAPLRLLAPIPAPTRAAGMSPFAARRKSSHG